MNLKLSSMALCVAACLFATAASAERVGTGGIDEPANDGARADTSTLHERLTREDGLTLVADGLYAKRDEHGLSFAATTHAGRLALAAKVREQRDALARFQLGKNITRTDRNQLKQLDEIIADLSQGAAKSSQAFDEYGGCGNGSGTHVVVSSANGRTAYAYASLELDFGPVTPTENFVIVNTDHLYDTAFTTAMMPASAALNDHTSCRAFAYASVGCPNGYPGLARLAESESELPRCDSGVIQ